MLVNERPVIHYQQDALLQLVNNHSNTVIHTVIVLVLKIVGGHESS